MKFSDKPTPTDAMLRSYVLEELAVSLLHARDARQGSIEIALESETADNILHLWSKVQQSYDDALS